MASGSPIEQEIKISQEDLQKQATQKQFSKLIQQTQYVGELYSINYETAKVQIHDFERQKVGGIPSLSFLIATRIDVSSGTINFREEDSSVILIRVMDAASLPNSSEAERIRVENAQRVSGTDNHWDNKDVMDTRTNVYLGYAAVECRIIGTLFLEQKDEAKPESPLILKFGCDISNYYPNRGLKVYKPNAKALEQIVNYIDPAILADYRERYKNTSRVQLGSIRYASTNRKHQQIDDVPVSIFPSDLLAQKSAVFGMTRTGKSNTVKIIAKSVYELRYPKNVTDEPLRIGQIIFDPNGEYANENVQDNNSALKNVWTLQAGADKDKEVVTYGIIGHPNDPDRKMMLLNFYLESNLQIGKDMIGALLSDETAIYLRNFTQVFFERPDPADRSATTRYNRRVLAYRAILHRAGFAAPSTLNPQTAGLFSNDLRQAMQNSQSTNAADYQSAATIFGTPGPTWGQIATAFETLDKFMRDNTSGYQQFESTYVNRPNGSGERWADEDLKKIIGLFQYQNGTRLIGRMSVQHTNSVSSDYAEDIYRDLRAGKLVIIDQSSGEPDINKSSAERILWVIFRKNQELFRQGEQNIPDILVYIEEAHNLLPSGNDMDTGLSYKKGKGSS